MIDWRRTVCGLSALLAVLLPAAGASHAPAVPHARAAIPGVLPLPHHDPDFGPEQVQLMREELFVFQNFGLYQGYGSAAQMYVHNGLDIMLSNGTRIFSVEPGVVRWIDRATPLYRSIIIESTAQPGYAWAYTHVDSFEVNVGDHVAQGSPIARVSFRDLDSHVHLDRLRLVEGGAWERRETHLHLDPSPFFDLPDVEPPVMDTIRFYRSDTGEAFAFRPGVPAVVSGNVDIVVGLRDAAPWARRDEPRSEFTGIGDRLAVTRIEYDIVASDGTTHRYTGHDFRRLELGTFDPTRHAATAGALYRFHGDIHDGAAWTDLRFSYYVISRAPQQPTDGRVRPADYTGVWATGVSNARGRRVFPDDDYTVVVRAWDAAGNVTTGTARVTVRNP